MAGCDSSLAEAASEKPIESFLKEATKELLYNILCNEQDELLQIQYKELSDKFVGKVGYEPMISLVMEISRTKAGLHI